LSIVQTTFITITCDAPGCGKTATFEASETGDKAARVENPWLATHRAVATPDRRNLGYCSDECEAKGIASGLHNKLEQRIIADVNPSAVNMAARAAEAARKSTEAIKAGQPTQVSLS
jgi:hypothetical protein